MLRGHKCIRILCLPVADTMRLHMDAPNVYTISNDTSSRRFYTPRGSVARLSKGADLRKATSKHLLGKSPGKNPAGNSSTKRLFDMFGRNKEEAPAAAANKVSVRAMPNGLMHVTGGNGGPQKMPSIGETSAAEAEEISIEVVTSE